MKNRQKTIILFLAYSGFLLLGLSLGVLGVAWESIRAEFDLPLEQAGFMIVASTIGYSLVSAYTGRLVQRYGIRLFLAGMVAFGGLGFAGITVSPVWLGLIVGSFITGAGTGGLDAGLNYYAAANLSPRVMNWLHATFGVGAAIIPIIFSTLLQAEQSWRASYALIFVLHMIVALAIFLTQGWQTLESLSKNEAAVKTHTPYQATLRIPIVWVSIALFAVYVGTELTPGQWADSLFIEARGLDVVTSASWVSLYWAGLTIGRIFFGAIANRYSIVTLLRFAMLGALLGIIGWWGGGSTPVSLIGLMLLGFSLGPIFPLLMSATPKRLGEHAANTIGFQMAAVGLGNAVLPSLAGFMAGRLGLEIIPPFILILAVGMTILHESLVTLSSRVPQVVTQT